METSKAPSRWHSREVLAGKDEYHIEVHVGHHLYPPYPFEDIHNIGVVWNVEPLIVNQIKTQADATVVAIVFVVAAANFDDAIEWCRQECQRLSLPILKLTRTQLLPGF